LRRLGIKTLFSHLINQNTTDVLATATVAYQQGKITKAQYFAVINALDESSSVTNNNYQIKVF
jgi:hypothetical protein